MPDHVGSETESPARKDVGDAVPHGKRNLLNRGLRHRPRGHRAPDRRMPGLRSVEPPPGTLLTMLPFAAALAVAALGQTLVVMQGGIDLSVAGGFSLYVVILTKYPAGDNARLWTALAIAFAASILVGCVNGMLIGRMGLNPIVATLGTNAMLYGAVFWYSNDIPTTTTARLSSFGGAVWLGIPAPVYVAVIATAFVTLIVKLTPIGRRFEGVGSNGTSALTAGIRVKRHRAGAYVWAQVLYCLGGCASRIDRQPADRPRRRQLPPSHGRSRRPRRHLAPRRPWEPRRHRNRSSLPLPARPVRALARRELRNTHACSGGRARGRYRALHDRLERTRAPAIRASLDNGSHLPRQQTTSLTSTSKTGQDPPRRNGGRLI